MSNNRILTLDDGFQWLLLSEQEARLLFEANSCEVYIIDGDGQESLVQDHSYFDRFDTFGIELGFRSKVNSVEVAEIVDKYINAIYKEIQDKIGQTDGGFASVFHSGDGDELQRKIVEHFIEYTIKENENMRSK